MTSIPDWLLILTGLGGGVVGSVITTYGTQTRQRREARSAAREAIRYAEDLFLHQPEHRDITAALARLENSAMLVGLPRRLTELHREARMRFWVIRTVPVTGDPEAISQHQSEGLVSGRVSAQAAKLLVGATWHPWAGAIYRWHRTRKLAQLLDAGMPVRAQLDRERRSDLRKWERDTIRQAKKAQENGMRGAT